MTHTQGFSNQVGVWNDIILTDARTKQGALDTAIRQATKKGWLYSDKSYTRVVQTISDALWQFDAMELIKSARDVSNPLCFDAAVPLAIRNGSASPSVEMKWIRQQQPASLARSIAIETVKTGVNGVLDADDNSTCGTETVTLMVVHQSTCDTDGFKQLLLALRYRQQELGLDLVRVQVHSATGRYWLDN